MKLSEAIREGSKKRPQTTGRCFREREDDSTMCSCALGAAYEGATGYGYSSDWTALNYLHETYKIDDTFVTHPVYGDREDVRQIVVGLNDDEGWTREQIADWLESEGL